MTDRPFHLHEPMRDSPWLVICDHATNAVPPEVNGGTLGLPATEMARHIAHDVGALGVTRHLADLLGAPAIWSRFSRLVIDPNRGEDDPTLIMRLYDGTIVPGNRHLTAAERARRLESYWRPYHDALEALAARPGRILVSVHSFTPRLNGRGPRPWHVGILSGRDRRLSDPLIAELARPGDLCIGDNEPYAGHLPGDTIDRHALVPGRPNTLIELRHDLIDTAATQRAWAERLAPALDRARRIAQL